MATSRKLFICAFLHYPLRKNLQLFLISFVFLFVAFLSFLYSVFNVLRNSLVKQVNYWKFPLRVNFTYFLKFYEVKLDFDLPTANHWWA